MVQGTDKSKGDDADATDGSEEVVICPAYISNWLEQLNIRLSFDEATFLANQIAAKVPESLLGQILVTPKLREQFVELPSDWNYTTFADEAPLVKVLSPELQTIIFAARDFWQLMYGAHIRYNCLLQDQHGSLTLKQEFEEEWDSWHGEMKRFPWNRWGNGFLWDLVSKHERRVRRHTTNFVESWIDG